MVGIGGADEDRTHDLLNAIQALSQTELRPHVRSNVANVFSRGKFRQRGGFYGTGLPWRNAEREGRKAAVGERCVLPLAVAPEAQSAGVFRGAFDLASEAEGGEAGGEEELRIRN